MSFIELDAPSSYDVLETTPRTSQGRTKTWAIIVRTVDYDKNPTGWSVLVPDAGDRPHELLKMYRDRERSNRMINNDREYQFRESLKVPHPYIQESRSKGRCYCGEVVSAEIHIEPEEALEDSIDKDPI